MLEIDSAPGELSSLFSEHMIQIIYKLVNAKFFHPVTYAVLALINFAKLGALRLEHTPDFKH